MSRTYRRKNTTKNGYWCDLEYYIGFWHYPFKDLGINISYRVFYPRDSKEYARGLARFHSDGCTTTFKEPGPSWFRRIFKRKYKAKVRNELSKFLKNPEYEVDLHDATEKYQMDYWT